MEELEIIEETPRHDYSGVLSVDELKQRRAVWNAMSEFWLHDTISDYDLNYIAIRLFEAGYDLVKLTEIFEIEVYPVLSKGQYVMDNRWHVVEANWLEDSIVQYLYHKQVERQQQSLSRKIVQKFGLTKKQGLERQDSVDQSWNYVCGLIIAMAEAEEKQTQKAIA